MNNNKDKGEIKTLKLCKFLSLWGFFAFFLVSPFAFADDPVQAPIPVAKVVWIKGSLSATASNKEQRNLQKDSLIYLKDTILILS